MPKLARMGLAVLLLLAAHWGWAAEATAAQIIAFPEQVRQSGPGHTPSDPVACGVRLSEAIEDGDAARFKEVVDKLRADLKADHRGKTIFICLDSGGGSVKEALQIARYIRWLGGPSVRASMTVSQFDSLLVTVVEERAVCASACALIFMAGSRLIAPLRYLHPRGRLRFHASFIDLQAKSNQQLLEWGSDAERLRAQISALYTLGLQDFRGLIETFDAVSTPHEGLQPPWVRPSLFLEVFSVEPTEWLCVDSIDQIGRWDIQLYSFAAAKRVTEPMVRDVCQNTFFWRLDRSARVPESAPGRAGDIPVFWPALDKPIGGRNAWSAGFVSRAIFIASSNYTQCVVEMNANSEAKIFYAEASGRRTTDVQDVLPTSFLAPDTILPEVAATEAPPAPPRGGGVLGGPASALTFREEPNRVMVGCNARRLNGVDLEACQRACRGDGSCAAYSFNKVSGTCELKHTLNATRLDPLWTTGVPATTKQDVPKSTRATVWARIGGDLAGEKTEIEAATFEQCVTRCSADVGCLGYSFYRGNPPKEAGRCVLFSGVAGIVDGRADSAVKRQR